METRGWIMCAAYVLACGAVCYAAVRWAKAGEHGDDEAELVDPKGCNCNHCLHRRRKERDRKDEKGDPS